MTQRQQQTFSQLATQLAEIALCGNCHLIQQLIEKWLVSNHYNQHNKNHFLHAFSSYLLQQVRNQQMQAKVASEILNNIIVFSELDIPLSVYASNNALQLIVENNKVTTNQTNETMTDDIKKHVSDAKASMSHLYPASQYAEQCRYSGRFHKNDKKIVNK